MKRLSQFLLLSFVYVSSVSCMDFELFDDVIQNDIDGFRNLLAVRDGTTCSTICNSAEFSGISQCKRKCENEQFETFKPFYKMIFTKAAVLRDDEEVQKTIAERPDLAESVEVVKKTPVVSILTNRDWETCENLCKKSEFSQVKNCQVNCFNAQANTFVTFYKALKLKNIKSESAEKAFEVSKEEVGDYADDISDES